LHEQVSAYSASVCVAVPTPLLDRVSHACNHVLHVNAESDVGVQEAKSAYGAHVSAGGRCHCTDDIIIQDSAKLHPIPLGQAQQNSQAALPHIVILGRAQQHDSAL